MIVMNKTKGRRDPLKKAQQHFIQVRNKGSRWNTNLVFLKKIFCLLEEASSQGITHSELILQLLIQQTQADFHKDPRDYRRGSKGQSWDEAHNFPIQHFRLSGKFATQALACCFTLK